MSTTTKKLNTYIVGLANGKMMSFQAEKMLFEGGCAIFYGSLPQQRIIAMFHPGFWLFAHIEEINTPTPAAEIGQEQA